MEHFISIPNGIILPQVLLTLDVHRNWMVNAWRFKKNVLEYSILWLLVTINEFRKPILNIPQSLPILKLLNFTFWYTLQKTLTYVFFWGGKGVDDGAPVTTADRIFVVCQIGKFIALFVNISRFVEKSREARSGRATYLKRETFKVRITPLR